MKTIIFFTGPQCSGKSHLAGMLGRYFDIPVLHIGKKLRKRHTVTEFIDSNSLVSAPACMDEEVERMIVAFLLSCAGPFCFVDSFPRNARQRGWLRAYSLDHFDERVLVVFVTAPLYVRFRRYLSRTKFSMSNMHYFIKREWQDKYELKRLFSLPVLFPIIKINNR